MQVPLASNLACIVKCANIYELCERDDENRESLNSCRRYLACPKKRLSSRNNLFRWSVSSTWDRSCSSSSGSINSCLTESGLDASDRKAEDNCGVGYLSSGKVIEVLGIKESDTEEHDSETKPRGKSRRDSMSLSG